MRFLPHEINISLNFILIFILMTGWLFSGWPRISENPPLPPVIKQVRAASVGPTNCGTGGNDVSIGSNAWNTPGNACTSGQSTTATVPTNYLTITNFGFSIPTGSKILGIGITVSRSSTNDQGGKAIDTAARIIKGGTIGSTDRKNTSDWSTTPVTYGGSTDLWGETWQASDINAINFGFAVAAVSSKTGKSPVGTISAFVTATIYYNEPPNAPTQDAPANSATGVSVTPNFLMTTTDPAPDSDNLGYKVTIYSNSGCSSVVSTHDQATDSTGWASTDASCTNNPTSCYLSGTQGDFTLQSGDALTGNTQYWWKASAKDPDGSGSFTDSSTCNTFTTGSASSLTFIVSTDNFPSLTPGSPVYATSTLSVDTNNASGWNVTLSANNKSLSANVLNDGGSNEIPDPTNEWKVLAATATTTGGNASTVTLGDDFLYFRVMTASGSPAFISTAWWGADDTVANAKWAGIASSTNVSRIGDSSVSSGAAPDLNTALFYLDVPNTQPTGTYTGTITFTATMN